MIITGAWGKQKREMLQMAIFRYQIMIYEHGPVVEGRPLALHYPVPSQRSRAMKEEPCSQEKGAKVLTKKQTGWCIKT